MKQRFYALLLLLCASTAPVLGKASLKFEPITYDYDDFSIRRESKVKLEGFYSKNVRLLNDDNCDYDKVVIPGKFTFDNDVYFDLNNPACDWKSIGFKINVRFKGTFGAPEASFKSGHATIKDLEAVIGSHSHPINVHIPVLRELKLQVNLNDLLGLSFQQKHDFTIGLFPFSLGRGIALGSAFSTTPDFLGYDPASSIDQYAPGFLFSGAILDNDVLDYDIYASILDNLSSSFADVNLKTQGQMYGHRFDQARGFGVLNYIFASRLKWTPVNENGTKIYIEPYGLFNDERDQKLEFTGDATMKLGTFGLAMEVTKGDWEFGFDVAHNIGKQRVKGLDRNIIKKELRQGVTYFVNSHVKQVTIDTTQTPDKTTASEQLVYNKTKQDGFDAPQDIVNNGIRGTVECSSLNSQNGIVLDDLLESDTANARIRLQNAADRFRDPYSNDLSGFMAVTDMSWKPCVDVKLALALGYASGDENPNKDLNELNESNMDSDYRGFVSLQEIYSGKRVRSAFLLSGKGKVPRLLSFPINKSDSNVDSPAGGFPATVSRFTNIAFVGASAYWDIERCTRNWKINPNVLTYWQTHATRIFDTATQQRDARACARKHLGTEINLYIDGEVLKGLKAFVVTGVFISGNHFDDVKGRPINKAEQKFLDAKDETGVVSSLDFVPALGNDNAFFLNAGLEYKF